MVRQAICGRTIRWYSDRMEYRDEDGETRGGYGLPDGVVNDSKSGTEQRPHPDSVHSPARAPGPSWADREKGLTPWLRKP